jgi:hypothetical protein
MDRSCFMLDACDTTIGASNEAEMPLSLGESSKNRLECRMLYTDLHKEWGNLEETEKSRS